MPAKRENTRVVIVDDSLTVRDLLTALYESAGFRVVGVGKTGTDAIKLVNRLKPDVVSMDVVMPEMDGFEATRQIMTEVPTPIVIVTTNLMRKDSDLTFEALKCGALAAVKKPGLDDLATCNEVVQTIRLMASVPVVRHWAPNHKTNLPNPMSSAIALDEKRNIKMIGIAASTGGPSVLVNILKPLPKDFPTPILVVQHVTNGFAIGLAQWLNDQIELTVRLAGHGETPEPGTVLLPPDDYHLQINKQGNVELSKAPPQKGLRPSANFLFHTMARFFGPQAIGVILTGMGDDGTDGLEALHRAGALTIAQDEQSCMVFGMPHEAILRNTIERVLNPKQIGLLLTQFSNKKAEG